MATGDFQFNFTNLNPLNTSGWSTSTLAAQIKARQDAETTRLAEEAARASVYGHMDAANSKGGNSKSKNQQNAALGLISGGAGTLFDSNASTGDKALALLTGGGSNIPKIFGFGSDDPRTPAEKLAHQTKMLAKNEAKAKATASTLAGEQHNIDALNEAIGKATDPSVIENLNKELEKAQKSFGKAQQKHDANTSLVDEVKKKVTGLETVTGTGAPAAPTKGNYFDELTDKALASRTHASGWHALGLTTGGENDLGVKLDPLTGEPVVATPAVTTPAITTPALPTFDPLTFGLSKKQIRKQALVNPAVPAATTIVPGTPYNAPTFFGKKKSGWGGV